MTHAQAEGLPVQAGDIQGLGSVYDRAGNLIGRAGESFLEIAEGWDLDVRSPWRRFLPKMLFTGFGGRSSSRLYVTTQRIVLVREIDAWRELSGEMTPLGIPTAISKEARLKQLKTAGVKQFCEVFPKALRLVSSRRYVKRGSMIDMRFLGTDGRQYAISFWKTNGKDEKVLSIIESRFSKAASAS